jgi:signal transduction histidine kinase
MIGIAHHLRDVLYPFLEATSAALVLLLAVLLLHRLTVAMATIVTFAARRMADGGVSMRVHDQGGGIPPDRLGTLFEKFTQLHPGSTNQGKGTGLGLAITRALVEVHGRSIHVASGRDSGTTFEIRLGGDGTSFAKVNPSSRSDA